MNDTIAFSVFADLHWREGDWSGCEARLDAIIDRTVRSRAEFIIHCGDFCHDVAAARGLIAKYAAAPIPAYHVMGNHEFECSDTLDDVLRAFSLPRNYYSFDVRGFRFVALDVNSASSDWTHKPHHGYPPELMAKCHVACNTLLNAEPVHAIVRLSMDGDVEIEGMKGAHFMGVTPESLGIDTTDPDGIKFDTDVLSAKFTLSYHSSEK